MAFPGNPKEMPMSRKLVCSALIVALSALVAGGCKPPEKKDYSRPLPPGAYALRKIAPENYPDFTLGFPANRQKLANAVAWSIDYLQHPSSHKYFPIQGLTHDQALASLQAFHILVQTAGSAEELQRGLVSSFDVYQSVGCDDKGTVLFTGYYTPILEGSLQRGGPYQYPLYKAPDNLVKDAEGQCQGLRQPDGRLAPCSSRHDLETNGSLKGLELVYLKDKIDVYVAQVQGSAIVNLPSGKRLEVGYAANNGYKYSSVGQALVADKKIAADELSLPTIRTYFQNHPAEADTYIQKNERFIFFRQSSGGPYGSLGTPVTPFETLATDKSIFPRACLTYVVTVMPWKKDGQNVRYQFSRFMLDQDTGDAFRAPGRADIYVGTGEKAGEMAGTTRNEGQLYYLFLKPGADRL
jgi:membrane-bound lytic murein transglycosylase A